MPRGTIAVVCSCLVLAAGGAALAQSSPGERDDFRPAAGFMLQGRMLSYVGASSGSAVVLYTPAGPGAAFGYRGRGWSLAFSPSYTSNGLSERGAAGRVSAFGFTAMVEAVVARALGGRAELNLLGGFGVALYDSGDYDPGVGAFAGVGGRYWVSRGLGLGVAFGESYSVATWSSVADRAKFDTFATFGAVDVTFVFGD
ncbi:MAG: hypothetical protein U0324_15610 [Polyangiales bacterium]